MDSSRLDRKEIRRILRRHRGAQAELVRRLGPSPRSGKKRSAGAISRWLSGSLPSTEIEAAARQLAIEYLEAEENGEKK